MKKTKKAMLSTLALALAATGTLAGCGTGGGGTPTVTVWSWRSQDAALWKQVQAALNAKGDKVNIQFRAINATSYDSVLQTAMDGGKGPDIFYGRAGVGTLDYAAANMISPVDKIANLSSINSAALQSVQWKGKTYGVPFAIQTMEVFYNKDIFKKYGLSVPKTWADFLHVCQVLKSHNVTPISTMGIQSWMLALNFDEIGATMLGNQFTQQLVDKQAKYTDAPYVDALSKYQSLAPYFESNFKAVGSAGNEQETQFALGNAAMVMDGIFDVPTIQQFNPKLNMGAFLIPPATSTQSAKIDWYVDGDIAMNSKISNTAEQKAAQEVLAFTATKQFGQDFSDIAGEISPIAGVQVPKKYPLSIQAYNWYQTVPISPIFSIRSPMDTPPPTPITSQTKNAASNDAGIYSAEQKVLLPLLTNQMTPAKAADEVQQTVNWYFK
ncbi:ABC transporter substrate-binding protein [Alicyclobacillus fastidiosus]|uniref:Extracellular solute-binding protein n=1 Tax=Alicyclobacillus fastidiosus TaxID=392011 RepID=A0ABV5ACC1_9BACL|nr:extracellular solute-binding protein [Alicyclobacillus fastidiosus]WEH10541.1 extracellular solute-binding protein [Alicyclobacillus fastidiosus]